MPAARKPAATKASPKKGGAEVAVAEVSTETDAKTVTFRQLTLTLPEQLPPTMLFHITDLEAAGGNPLPVFRLLREILGAEQFNDVRTELTGDSQVVSAVDGLLGDIFDQYGIGLGESSASQNS